MRGWFKIDIRRRKHFRFRAALHRESSLGRLFALTMLGLPSGFRLVRVGLFGILVGSDPGSTIIIRCSSVGIERP